MQMFCTRMNVFPTYICPFSIHPNVITNISSIVYYICHVAQWKYCHRFLKHVPVVFVYSSDMYSVRSSVGPRLSNDS